MSGAVPGITLDLRKTTSAAETVSVPGGVAQRNRPYSPVDVSIELARVLQTLSDNPISMAPAKVDKSQDSKSTRASAAVITKDNDPAPTPKADLSRSDSILGWVARSPALNARVVAAYARTSAQASAQS